MKWNESAQSEGGFTMSLDTVEQTNECTAERT